MAQSISSVPFGKEIHGYTVKGGCTNRSDTNRDCLRCGFVLSASLGAVGVCTIDLICACSAGSLAAIHNVVTVLNPRWIVRIAASRAASVARWYERNVLAWNQRDRGINGIHKCLDRRVPVVIELG